MTEIYVSTDVESDGSAPGLNSMLSFASAAYLADKTLLEGPFQPIRGGEPVLVFFLGYQDLCDGVDEEDSLRCEQGQHVGALVR